jgi:beta-lactamase regulating signal transducer with metallopeptidase domain
MTTELLDLLVRMTLASSAAMVLVWLVRRALRRLAGARAAYLCWLAVPASLVAATLPALAVAPVRVVAMMHAAGVSTFAASVTPATVAPLDWVLGAWAGGALATAMLFLLGQRAFVRSLGTLAHTDGVFHAAAGDHGPALLGLFYPIIVVPADFALRYSAEEQALILAHERQHAARRDPAANAVLALLRCVFWFNPLIHIAAAYFRFDQELACDADVMARHGAQRQAYAGAMLKTQARRTPALAACHWQSSHPLKERIMQLKQTSISTTRRRAGHLLVALFACATVLGTVTARAGVAKDEGVSYDVAVQFDKGDGNTSAKVLVKAGEDVALRWDQPGQSWSGVFNFTPAGDSVMVRMKLTLADGKVMGPSMLVRLGEQGSLVMGDAAKPTFQIGLKVTRAAS